MSYVVDISAMDINGGVCVSFPQHEFFYGIRYDPSGHTKIEKRTILGDIFDTFSNNFRCQVLSCSF